VNSRKTNAKELPIEDLDAVTIRNRKREMDLLIEENIALGSRLNSVLNQIERRSLTSEVRRNQEEIARLENIIIDLERGLKSKR
jgi:hypothetical protein